MTIGTDAKEILLKNINLVGIATDILDRVLQPALQKVVDDSSNPFDDVLMATVYPTLEAELKKLIAEQVAKI